MKTNQIQEIIRKVISEAKEDIKKKKETGLPKSSGKLVELKKELTSLKRMKESLPQSTVNEGDETTGSLTVEYAHMQKFVNEIEKIKAMTAKLSEMLGTQINEVEEKIKSETQKIKEMIGLAPKKGQEKIIDEAEISELKPGVYVELISGEMNPGTQYQVQKIEGGYATVKNPEGKEFKYNIDDIKVVQKKIDESKKPSVTKKVKTLKKVTKK